MLRIVVAVVLLSMTALLPVVAAPDDPGRFVRATFGEAVDTLVRHRNTIDGDPAAAAELIDTMDSVPPITSLDGPSGVDATTGEEEWRLFADGLSAVSPLPTVVDGTVYSKGATTLYAVDGPTSQQGTDDPDDNGTDDPDDDSNGSSGDGDGPGFGVLVVAVALAAVAALAGRRR